MEKTKNSKVWIDAGYNLFASEGLEGIQVERLARILQLNKSGFYHYFGDLDVYIEELLKLHEENGNRYLEAVRRTKTIDPDYFQVLVDFQVTAMFQTQLTRVPNKPAYQEAVRKIDEPGIIAIQQLWCDYLGLAPNSESALHYFKIVRDVFYARINFQNMTIPFLRGLLGEAKEVLNEIKQSKGNT